MEKSISIDVENSSRKKMIKYLTRKELDIVKYNACIANSVQSRIYGYSWYLDIVADNWDVLVLDDYKAVMPLPWKRKYFIKYCTQPLFTQQLGVFSFVELNEDTMDAFIKIGLQKFVRIALQFNAENKIVNQKVKEKINYVLNLDRSYQELYKKYTKGRKHAVKQGLKNKLNIAKTSIKELVKLAKENYSYYNFTEEDYQKLEKLVTVLSEMDKIIIIGVRLNNSLIGGSVFILDSNRIIYLFSAVTEKGKQQQVPSLLLDSMIKKYSDTKMLLDFEGSMIKSIASFFKSFGAKQDIYIQLKKQLINL